MICRSVTSLDHTEYGVLEYSTVNRAYQTYAPNPVRCKIYPWHFTSNNSLVIKIPTTDWQDPRQYASTANQDWNGPKIRVSSSTGADKCREQWRRPRFHKFTENIVVAAFSPAYVGVTKLKKIPKKFSSALRAIAGDVFEVIGWIRLCLLHHCSYHTVPVGQ